MPFDEPTDDEVLDVFDTKPKRKGIYDVRPDRIRSIPEGADQWSIDDLPNIASEFEKRTGQKLPTRAIGQGNIHRSQHWDHRNAFDVGLNPNTPAGKALIDILTERGAPFQAFNRAVRNPKTGRISSTGPHIHGGMPSRSTTENIPVGTRLSKQTAQPTDEVLDVFDAPSVMPENTSPLLAKPFTGDASVSDKFFAKFPEEAANYGKTKPAQHDDEVLDVFDETPTVPQQPVNTPVTAPQGQTQAVVSPNQPKPAEVAVAGLAELIKRSQGPDVQAEAIDAVKSTLNNTQTFSPETVQGAINAADNITAREQRRKEIHRQRVIRQQRINRQRQVAQRQPDQKPVTDAEGNLILGKLAPFERQRSNVEIADRRRMRLAPVLAADDPYQVIGGGAPEGFAYQPNQFSGLGGPRTAPQSTPQEEQLAKAAGLPDAPTAKAISSMIDSRKNEIRQELSDGFARKSQTGFFPGVVTPETLEAEVDARFAKEQQSAANTARLLEKATPQERQAMRNLVDNLVESGRLPRDLVAGVNTATGEADLVAAGVLTALANAGGLLQGKLPNHDIDIGDFRKWGLLRRDAAQKLNQQVTPDMMDTALQEIAAAPQRFALLAATNAVAPGSGAVKGAIGFALPSVAEAYGGQESAKDIAKAGIKSGIVGGAFGGAHNLGALGRVGTVGGATVLGSQAVGETAHPSEVVMNSLFALGGRAIPEFGETVLKRRGYKPITIQSESGQVGNIWVKTKPDGSVVFGRNATPEAAKAARATGETTVVPDELFSKVVPNPVAGVRGIRKTRGESTVEPQAKPLPPLKAEKPAEATPAPIKPASGVSIDAVREANPAPANRQTSVARVGGNAPVGVEMINGEPNAIMSDGSRSPISQPTYDRLKTHFEKPSPPNIPVLETTIKNHEFELNRAKAAGASAADIDRIQSRITSIQEQIDAAKPTTEKTSTVAPVVKESLTTETSTIADTPLPKVDATRFANNKLFTADKVEAARARIANRKTGGTGNPDVQVRRSGADPYDLADYAIIGAAHIESGARNFAEFSKRMIDDFDEGIKPHLDKIYAQSKDTFEKVPTLEDLGAIKQKAPLTDVPPPPPPTRADLGEVVPKKPLTDVPEPPKQAESAFGDAPIPKGRKTPVGFREHAATQREAGRDVADVPYDPQSVPGWEAGAKETVDTKGTEDAIREFKNTPDRDEGRKTALGNELLDRLTPGTAEFNDVAEHLITHIGEAAQTLRASQEISRRDPKNAVKWATMGSQHGRNRGLTLKEAAKVQEIADRQIAQQEAAKPVDEALKEVERKATPRKSKSLTLSEYVASQGGIIEGVDKAGEVRRLSQKETGKRGVVNNKSGHTAEDMARMAYEEGYLRGDEIIDAKYGEIDPAKFLEMVAEDANGTRKHRNADDLTEFDDSEAWKLHELKAAERAEYEKHLTFLEDPEVQLFLDDLAEKPGDKGTIKTLHTIGAEHGLTKESVDAAIKRATEPSNLDWLAENLPGQRKSATSEVKPNTEAGKEPDYPAFRDRDPEGFARLQAQRTAAKGKRVGRKATRPITYEVRLKNKAAAALDKLKGRVLDFGGSVKVGERGAIKYSLETPALKGDLETVAEYVSGELPKIESTADLTKKLVDLFGPEVEPHVKTIRDRAYTIRAEVRRAEAKNSPERRQTILGEIRKEIQDANQAIRDAEKYDELARKSQEAKTPSAPKEPDKAQAATRAIRQLDKSAREAEAKARISERDAVQAERRLKTKAGNDVLFADKAKKEAMAKREQASRDAQAAADARQTANDARQQYRDAVTSGRNQRLKDIERAKIAKEAERKANNERKEEARTRAAQAADELNKARKAEDKAYRDELKAARERDRKEGQWDNAQRQVSAEATERLKTATDAKDPGTHADLVAAARGFLLPDEAGGTPRLKAVGSDAMYRFLNSFPNLNLTKRQAHKIFTEAYQSQKDMIHAVREVTRLRSASKESAKLWDKFWEGEPGGRDISTQALLLQKADLQRQANELRLEQQREFERLSQNPVRRGLTWVGGSMRGLRSSVDSPLGRQGLAGLLAHPWETVKTVPTSIKAYGMSPREFERYQEQFRNRPGYEQARDAMGIKFDQTEEQFYQSAATRLPHVKRSEQGYSAQMNEQRLAIANLYAKWGEYEGYTPENNPKFYKEIGRIVNVMSGRGDLTENQKAIARVTQDFLFSPRLNISRIQMIKDAVTLPYKWKSYDPVTRKIYAENMIKTATFLAITYGAAKMFGADIGVNPLSPDFGKIKKGNTRFDPTGGEAGMIRLLFVLLMKGGGATITAPILNAAARQVSSTNLPGSHAVGSYLSSGGKELKQTPVGPIPVGLGVFQQLRYKASPLAGTALEAASVGYNAIEKGRLQGKDAIGNPVTVVPDIYDPLGTLKSNIFLKMIEPMVMGDFIDAYQDMGVKGLGVATPSLLGFGVNTYDENADDKEKKDEKEKAARDRRRKKRGK